MEMNLGKAPHTFEVLGIDYNETVELVNYTSAPLQQTPCFYVKKQSPRQSLVWLVFKADPTDEVLGERKHQLS